jgi:hypothetical protein
MVTKAQLISALRDRMIWRITQPGMPTGDKPIGYSCQLCNSEWKIRAPEKHEKWCVLDGTAPKGRS